MTVTLPRPLTVAIIGAGPGGLATAIALSRNAGVSVSVYEQASVLREVGAGISIGANSWRVLDALGVAESLVERGGWETWRVGNL